MYLLQCVLLHMRVMTHVNHLKIMSVNVKPYARPTLNLKASILGSALQHTAITGSRSLLSRQLSRPARLAPLLDLNTIRPSHNHDIDHVKEQSMVDNPTELADGIGQGFRVFDGRVKV